MNSRYTDLIKCLSTADPTPGSFYLLELNRWTSKIHNFIIKIQRSFYTYGLLFLPKIHYIHILPHKSCHQQFSYLNLPEDTILVLYLPLHVNLVYFWWPLTTYRFSISIISQSLRLMNVLYQAVLGDLILNCFQCHHLPFLQTQNLIGSFLKNLLPQLLLLI